MPSDATSSSRTQVTSSDQPTGRESSTRTPAHVVASAGHRPPRCVDERRLAERATGGRSLAGEDLGQP